jgi:hypothetical protein
MPRSRNLLSAPSRPIEAHLTIVFAALDLTRLIEERTG